MNVNTEKSTLVATPSRDTEAQQLQAIPRRILSKGFRERLQVSLGTLQANITKNDRDLWTKPPSPPSVRVRLT